MAISSEGLTQEEYESLDMFPSWSLIGGVWTPPKPKPKIEGVIYNWNEEEQDWKVANVQG